jgi:putative ABC transport system permease protein
LLKADLYVAPAGIGSASSEGTLSAATWQSLAKDPAVAGVDVIRHFPIVVDGRRTVLAGSEYADHERSLRLSWRQKPDDPDPTSLKNLTPAGLHPGWVSESFAIRFNKQRGDFIDLPTPAGMQRVEIAGVYIDYHNESGTVVVNRKFLVEWYGGSEAISSMAVFLKPDANIDQIRQQWTSEHPSLVIRTNTRLRDEALRVFHQTFAVTHALEAIGIAVAVAGLALTLASLMIERRSEVMTLKQLGMTRQQLAKATAIESVGIAGIGTAVGLLLSLALGYVLIYVVNRQSFGWTLEFAVPWLTFVGLALVTLLTSATVGWFIGRNGTHLKAERQE